MKLWNRHSLIIAVATAAALVSGFCGRSGTAPVQPFVDATPRGNTGAPGSATVSIPSGATGKGPAAYGVNPLVIQQGTTVTWVNNDSMPHTATSTSGIWDSGVLNSGQNYSFAFENVGTFPYICTIHGAASMSGTIQVTEAQNPGG
jgi:plastocyanin